VLFLSSCQPQKKKRDFAAHRRANPRKCGRQPLAGAHFPTRHVRAERFSATDAEHKAVFSSSLKIFLETKSRRLEILNKVYLQNFYIDEL